MKILMKTKLMVYIFGFSSAFFCISASAMTVVDLIGDKDGFGIGATDGGSFDWTAIGTGDGDGTDVWRMGNYNYTHTYSLAALGGAPITSASLEVFTGGAGFNGVGALSVDGSYVGDLTCGDFQCGATANIANIDVFDLSPFLAFINGSETISIVLDSGDGWALDYSELTVAASEVPIPAAAWLFGSGLLGLVAAKRRQRS